MKANEQTEVKTPVKQDASTKQSVAKAGKRSAKAIQAAEEKVAKESRKTSIKDSEPTKASKPEQTKPHVKKRSKAYNEKAKTIDHNKLYTIEEAVEIINKTSTTKFDATVEAHIRLGVDPRQADQNVRDTVILPSGSGKNIRVAAYVEDDDSKTALESGADIAGITELNKLFESGNLNFDTIVTTPAQMPKLAKYARTLGPRGLMPNPKSGTVTIDITKAISESKGGKVEYRVDATGIIHLGIGKVSFKPDQLLANLQAVLDSVRSNKPSSLKGNYIISGFLTTTMGPSIKLSL